MTPSDDFELFVSSRHSLLIQTDVEVQILGTSEGEDEVLTGGGEYDKGSTEGNVAHAGLGADDGGPATGRADTQANNEEPEPGEVKRTEKRPRGQRQRRSNRRG